MLSPEELEEYGWDLLGGAQAVLSAEMLRIIMRYYALSCTLSPSDRRRLMELSVSQRREIDAVLARYNPVVGQQAVELTSDLLDTSNARDADRLSEHYHRPASDLSDESRQAAVGVAMIVERDNVSMGDNANRLWYEVSAWTTTEVATGTKSLDEIIAQGVEELLAHGLDSVQYVDSDGNLTVRNSVDVAIRRHAMTQANQAAARMTLEHMEEFGHDLVQTTAHMGARPTHEVWQGRAFSLSGERTIDGVTYPDFYAETGYGTVQGLCGANCRHQFYPHFPGDPLPPRPDTEESNRQYKESQKQRRLEREIRKAKKEAAGYELAAEEATDPTVAEALRKKAEEARMRVGSLQAQMREHIAENDDFLVRQPKREKDYLGRARSNESLASIRAFDSNGSENRVEYTRRKPTDVELRRANIKPVNESLYHSQTNYILRHGGEVHRGDELANSHLDAVNQDASSLGTAVFFRDPPTTSEVLEETFHFQQEERGDYDDTPTERQLLREIDAQNYLLSVTERYNIPEEEVEQTKANLEYYEQKLAEQRGR